MRPRTSPRTWAEVCGLMHLDVVSKSVCMYRGSTWCQDSQAGTIALLQVRYISESACQPHVHVPVCHGQGTCRPSNQSAQRQGSCL